MLVVVIATGNHYWIDGVVGVAFTVGVMYAFEFGLRAWRAPRPRRYGTALVRIAALVWTTMGENVRAQVSLLSLGGLLAYMVVAQIVDPGFTDFWGYLVAQVVIILALLIAGEVAFGKQGGLSWVTHVIAIICTYADVLGTDGNLYARIDEYDKLTHFAGVAAFTAGTYEVLRLLYRSGRVPWSPSERLVLAVSAGFTIGIGWELYEVLGDRLFGTTRVNSNWDTANDIISDTLGAVAIGLLLWAGELSQQRGERDVGVSEQDLAPAEPDPRH
jgi:uncharacterized membrane protein YjdF